MNVQFQSSLNKCTSTVVDALYLFICLFSLRSSGKRSFPFLLLLILLLLLLLLLILLLLLLLLHQILLQEKITRANVISQAFNGWHLNDHLRQHLHMVSASSLLAEIQMWSATNLLGSSNHIIKCNLHLPTQIYFQLLIPPSVYLFKVMNESKNKYDTFQNQANQQVN